MYYSFDMSEITAIHAHPREVRLRRKCATPACKTLLVLPDLHSHKKFCRL